MAVITGSNSFNSPKDILNNSYYRYNSDLESISLPNDYNMEEDDKLIANYEREERERSITSSYNNVSNGNFKNQKEEQLKNNYGNIATLNLKNRWSHRISSNNNVNLYISSKFLNPKNFEIQSVSNQIKSFIFHVDQLHWQET